MSMTPTRQMRILPRVDIANPTDGGLGFWLIRLYAFALLALAAFGAYALLGLYVYFSAQLPPLPDLAHYADDAPGVTTLYGQDGAILAELSTQRRELVSLDRVPE